MCGINVCVPHGIHVVRLWAIWHKMCGDVGQHQLEQSCHTKHDALGDGFGHHEHAVITNSCWVLCVDL